MAREGYRCITGTALHPCAEEYDLLREELDRAGTPIGPNDLSIAATARVHRAVLVTHNVRELSRVAELRLEDWESR